MKKLLYFAAFIFTAFCFVQCDTNSSDEDCVCTGDYDPVCADGVTYSNSCEAHCAGAHTYTMGKCQ